MNGFDLSDNYNDPESDLSLDIIRQKKEFIAYGLYAKLRGYLYHYNLVKLRYKLLASTWFLATFMGYGYILSGEEAGLPFQNILGIALISVLSSAGIFLLWFFDLLIYHRMLGAVFMASLDLEDQNHFLGNAHHNSIDLSYHGKTGPVLFDGLVYVGFIFILLSIGDLSCYLYLNQTGSMMQLWIPVGLGVAIVTILFTLIRSSRFASENYHYEDHPVLDKKD